MLSSDFPETESRGYDNATSQEARMKSLLLIYAGCFSVVLCACAAPLEPAARRTKSAAVEMPSQHMARALYRDMRSVYDTASLRFKDFVANGKPDWTLAIVTPALWSGSATIPGAYIVAETGKIVTPPNPHEVIVRKGDWVAIASAQATTKKSGSYSWSDPVVEPCHRCPPWRPVIEDIYSPFDYSPSGQEDIVLFRFDPAAKDRKQFISARLLFDSWTIDVEPAFEFVAGHPGLLEDGQTSTNELPILKDLLSGTNRLLAVEAFRELVESRQMTPAMAQEQISKKGNKLCAVFSYLILASSATENLPPQLNQVIRNSYDPATLRSVALGAFAAAWMKPGTDVSSRALATLKAVATQTRALYGTPANEKDPYKDAYLTLIFQQTGIF